MTVATALSMLGVVVSIIISVTSLVFSRKDKSNKDTDNTAYHRGQIDKSLETINNKLDKIEKKLDTYDVEIDKRIEKALKQHELIYHKGELA